MKSESTRSSRNDCYLPIETENVIELFELDILLGGHLRAGGVGNASKTEITNAAEMKTNDCDIASEVRSVQSVSLYQRESGSQQHD